MLLFPSVAHLAVLGLAADDGRLGRLLGMFPGLPGLPLDQLQLGQHLGADQFDVLGGRFDPFLLNGLQVGRNGRLRDVQFFGDGRLRPALKRQIGHLSNV